MAYLTTVRFISVPSKQGRKGNIQGAWDPDRSMAVITAMGVLVEEVFSDIGMNSRRSVINLECDDWEEWINSIE